MRRLRFSEWLLAGCCSLAPTLVWGGEPGVRVRGESLPEQVTTTSPALQKALLLGGTKLIWSNGPNSQLIGLEIRGQQATDETLATVGQLTDLRLLLVAPSDPKRVTDRGVAHLKNLAELEFLSLAGTSVTNRGLEVVQSMQHLKRIELPAAANDDAMNLLANLPELEQVRVWPAKITNAGLQQLAKNPCLRILDLSGTQIDNEGVKLLQQLDGLELLDLRDTRTTADALALLQPKMDNDLMYAHGPHLLRRLFLNTSTVLDSRQVDDLIRLLGMCEIDTSRPQAEPGKAPRPAETVTPEITTNWLDRAKLEGYRMEISYWRALGAYVEFEESLALDPAAPVPAGLLEPPMTAVKLEQLSRFFQAQANQHVIGLHFIRPRSKDERPRDDTIFPAGLGNRLLPAKLERVSFRDTEITVTTFLSVIAPAMRAGTPIKVINVFNTATKPTASLSKPGIDPYLGAPARGRASHVPFNPGQPEMIVPGAPSRPTLTPEDLRTLEEALTKLDRLVVTEEQAERFKAALPGLADKMFTRPRYLPDEKMPCAENQDGTLKPLFSGPATRTY